MLSADISFSYPDGTEVFSHFRFTVPDGGCIKIIAPPGSGKTTLAKILTGSVPVYSGGKLSGTFKLGNSDIFQKSIPDRLENVGRVSQNTDEMMLFSSIEEEVAFPLANAGFSDDEIERRTGNVLSLFDLERFRGVPASELSGGEKRRLMLAVLFAVDPEVYILDESFDELSPEWRRKLVRLVNESSRIFIILGSHELHDYTMIEGETISIENGGAAVYQRERIPSFSYVPKFSFDTLEVSSLSIRRKHRSIADSDSFNLLVPSFSIRGGECVVLTGENGTGKSSFARVLSGLVEEEHGSVLFNGREIAFRERKRRVAYLMQNPYEELFLPTVNDEVRSTGAGDEDTEKVLSLFHLKAEWYSAEISYGKAKLLQAAVFFLLKRPFAVFDEFDSALSYEESLGAVKAYLENGAGVIVITHDTVFASLLPGRHLHIEDGVLHEC